MFAAADPVEPNERAHAMASLARHVSQSMNMSDGERLASFAGGGLLAAYAARRGDPLGWALTLLGGSLAVQGLSGRSPLHTWLNVQRHAGAGGAAAVIRGSAVHVERSVTVLRPVEEVYAFWRRLENLPRFMQHVVSVTSLGPNLHRWVARGPLGTVQWDAEIFEEHSPWFIAWRSLPGSAIRNAGSVRFSPAPAGRGTELHVSLAYKPPAGALGAAIARLMGEEPALQVADDLRRFKQIMETGEIPTVAGQPAGKRS